MFIFKNLLQLYGKYLMFFFQTIDGIQDVYYCLEYFGENLVVLLSQPGQVLGAVWIVDGTGNEGSGYVTDLESQGVYRE